MKTTSVLPKVAIIQPLNSNKMTRETSKTIIASSLWSSSRKIWQMSSRFSHLVRWCWAVINCQQLIRIHPKGSREWIQSAVLTGASRDMMRAMTSQIDTSKVRSMATLTVSKLWCQVVSHQTPRLGISSSRCTRVGASKTLLRRTYSLKRVWRGRKVARIRMRRKTRRVASIRTTAALRRS